MSNTVSYGKPTSQWSCCLAAELETHPKTRGFYWLSALHGTMWRHPKQLSVNTFTAPSARPFPEHRQRLSGSVASEQLQPRAKSVGKQHAATAYATCFGVRPRCPHHRMQVASPLSFATGPRSLDTPRYDLKCPSERSLPWASMTPRLTV